MVQAEETPQEVVELARSATGGERPRPRSRPGVWEKPGSYEPDQLVCSQVKGNSVADTGCYARGLEVAYGPSTGKLMSFAVHHVTSPFDQCRVPFPGRRKRTET